MNLQEKFEKQELHEMQDELEDLRDCGIGGCRPKILQALANIKVRAGEKESKTTSGQTYRPLNLTFHSYFCLVNKKVIELVPFPMQVNKYKQGTAG